MFHPKLFENRNVVVTGAGRGSGSRSRDNFSIAARGFWFTPAATASGRCPISC